MRMFVGITLPSIQREAIGGVMSHLSLPDESFRRSRPEGWHITLQFLGEVSPEQQECLVSRLREVSSAPVRLHLTGIGWLGIGILAVHIEPVPELALLAKEVVAATRLCGFQPDERPWHPHITLARRKAKARGGLPRIEAMLEDRAIQRAWQSNREFATEFCLFESFSDPQGQRYSVRARFPMERSSESQGRS